LPTKLLVLIAAVGALIALPLSTGAAWAQKRVALVIGNGAYQNVATLPNPIKDATAVADMFKKAGFEWVKLREDLGNLEFKRALREFMDVAQDADIAVVYYAGHGIQVRDMNYMIPVDAKLATETDAEDEAVSLERIVMALEPAKRLRLIILDACRDNPFARTMKRRVAVRAIGDGLAKMEPMLSDTLIAYAAKAGSTAEDGDGENSPFAAALVKHLSVAGLDIRLAFGRVRDEVLKRSRNRQEPYVYGSVGGQSISLVPAPAQPKVDVLSDVKGDYELVERIGTPEAWEAFLGSHKEGLYANLARAQLAKLQAAQKAAAPIPIESSSRGDAQEREEKARAEREAVQRREEEAKRLKAEEAARKLAERETAQRREDEAKRLKAEEAARKLAEREAAQRREEDARRLKAEEAARKLAERESEIKREEGRRLAKSTEQDRKSQDDTCSRDNEKLARLRGSLAQGWAREDLKRLQQNTACDRVRSDAVTLLAQLTAPEAGQQRAATEPPPANTPELILSAQGELRRLGCFVGEEDGRLGDATTAAIRRYLLEKGRSSKDIKVTVSLIADLKDQSTRVCPLTCSRGEHAEGDRCVVNPSGKN
jgi:Caspase domain